MNVTHRLFSILFTILKKTILANLEKILIYSSLTLYETGQNVLDGGTFPFVNIFVNIDF